MIGAVAYFAATAVVVVRAKTRCVSASSSGGGTRLRDDLVTNELFP